MRFENVTLSYPGHVLFEDLSVLFERGSFTYITWPSWSGKSTLLRVIIGDVIPRLGHVYDDRWDNILEFNRADLQQHRRRCGFVYQDYQLIDYKTVSQNIAFGMEVCGYHSDQIENKIPELLGKVGLHKKANSYPHELSWGEQQRVAIARALIHDPEIILADEPTGNLDEANTNSIVRLFEELHSLGSTVIFATHDLNIVKNSGHPTYEISDQQLITK